MDKKSCCKYLIFFVDVCLIIGQFIQGQEDLMAHTLQSDYLNIFC